MAGSARDTMTLLIGALGVIAVYLLVLAIVAVASVMPPRIPVMTCPAQLGLPQQRAEFTTEDGTKLRGWWVQGGTHTVVVCAHGYLTNKCELLPYAPRLLSLGCSVMLFDFRCHGQSQRRRATFGLAEKLDVKAAVKYARERCPGAKIILFGSSVGGTACALAVGDDPALADAIILDSAFVRLHEGYDGWSSFFMRGRFRYLLRPVCWFAARINRVDPGKLDVVKALDRSVSIPTLFLQGRLDPLIPQRSMNEAAQAAGPLAVVEWFEGSNHCEPRFKEPARYADAVFDFVKEHGGLAKSRTPARRSSAAHV